VFPFLTRRTHDPSWFAWPTASALGNRRALLLSPRQFEREVARERVRSTRRSIPFCVLTVELLAFNGMNGTNGINGAGAMNLASDARDEDVPATKRIGRRASVLKKQTRKIVDILHHNLRMTDEKGVLSATRYGVLLVDTPEMGGRAVLDRLTQLVTTAGLNVWLSLQVHDPEGFGDREDPDSSSNRGADNRRRDDGDASDDSDWVRKPVISLDASVAVLEPKKTRVEHGHASPAHASPAHLSPAHLSPAHLAQENRVSIASENSTYSSPLTFRLAKRTLDLVGAGTGLLLSAPFLALAVIAIKWSDRGPAFFCQTREGRHGQPFTIYKLRTMIVDAEKSQAALRTTSHRGGPAFKISKDPRVTQVGQFLRSRCLDELPQLINVLKGDMSLVGPRPLPWHESRACERWHRRRLDVRPGLTCIWQVDKAKAETFDDWMRMDLQYIDRFGFFKDIQLIARTVVVPVTGRGGE